MRQRLIDDRLPGAGLLGRIRDAVPPTLARLLVLAAALLIAWPAPTLAADSGGEQARREFFDAAQREQKFQRAEQIFPVRFMAAARTPQPLPPFEGAEALRLDYEWQGHSYDINAFNERTNTNALLILKNGRIVREIYRNHSLPSTRFISFSSGKSVTSTLVGMALAEGLITNLDDPLTRYLPALIGSAYAGVTIAQALQMTSGVEWDEEAYDWSDTSKPLVRNWQGAYVEQRYRMVEGANALPRARPAGTHFNYSTMETSILGWLVETVSRQRLAAFAEQRLWQPGGMEFDGGWVLDGPDPLGREMAGGGLLATLRDFGRFGLLMADAGKLNGRQLVPARWVTEATRPHGDPVQYGNLVPGYPLGYGYQWWLFKDGRYVAEGVYGQLIYVAPAEA